MSFKFVHRNLRIFAVNCSLIEEVGLIFGKMVTYSSF